MGRIAGGCNKYVTIGGEKYTMTDAKKILGIVNKYRKLNGRRKTTLDELAGLV